MYYQSCVTFVWLYLGLNNVYYAFSAKRFHLSGLLWHFMNFWKFDQGAFSSLFWEKDKRRVVYVCFYLAVQELLWFSQIFKKLLTVRHRFCSTTYREEISNLFLVMMIMQKKYLCASLTAHIILLSRHCPFTESNCNTFLLTQLALI